MSPSLACDAEGAGGVEATVVVQGEIFENKIRMLLLALEGKYVRVGIWG